MNLDVISRIQNHNLPLPTVHEESVNFDVNINSKDVVSKNIVVGTPIR